MRCYINHHMPLSTDIGSSVYHELASGCLDLMQEQRHAYRICSRASTRTRIMAMDDNSDTSHHCILCADVAAGKSMRFLGRCALRQCVVRE